MSIGALKTFVVTGANRAIELEWVKQLLVRPGHRILAGVSNPSGLPDVAVSMPGIEVMALDLGDPHSVELWADAVARSTQHVDVLIDNAGVATSLPNIRLSTRQFANGSPTDHAAPLTPVMLALDSRRLLGGYAGETLLARVSGMEQASAQC